jgi:hypothetical protein
MEKSIKWETVTEERFYSYGEKVLTTSRLKVPGGWIYRFKDSLVFVPQTKEVD